jgi:hypothetical protein
MQVQHILGLLRAGNGEQALRMYLESYAEVHARSFIEWEIAEAALSYRIVVDGVVWPAELLRRPSGATLALILAQLSLKPTNLPACLNALPAIRLRHRDLLARAWKHSPDNCPDLRNAMTRERFALWLCESQSALPDCLIAGAALRDEKLVDLLGSRWLRCGLNSKDLASRIKEASHFELLRRFVSRAIWVALTLAGEDRDALYDLSEAAWRLQDYEAVIAIAERWLAGSPKCESTEPQSFDQLARRCCAWAELGHYDRVLSEYRNRWYISAVPFPYPQPVLETLQSFRQDEMEHHLLRSAPERAEDPEWLRLSRTAVAKKKVERVDLEAWDQLYFKDRLDRAVLVGFSSALLKSPGWLRQEWLGRDGQDNVMTTWRELSYNDKYRQFAGAWLVLLAPDRLTQIAEFERCLMSAPLEGPPYSDAARLYLSALRRERHWSKLRALMDKSGSDAFAACAYNERVITRTLAQLHTLPAQGEPVIPWMRLWERLLSSSLEPAEVIEVLQCFSRIREQARQSGSPVRDHFRFADVELQLLRRGKVEAERMIGSPQRMQELGLEDASLETTIQIMEAALAEQRFDTNSSRGRANL